MSGHYFAYIKDVEDGEWYKFNDMTVTKADILDVVSAFGSKT
jgi:ubiquitin C-terminal hydrolase